MSYHSIAQLEQLSNVKSHTIRIWEQRYGLLKPERTDTNIRYYDDEQLKKLLNICTLLKAGMKISEIGKLSDNQINGYIQRTISTSSDVLVESFINQAVFAATTYDEILFEKMFSSAILRLGLSGTYEKIIYPLLVRTGLMWNASNIIPSQEHFISNLIRQKLSAAIDALPLLSKPKQTWVLFLNEEEEHEIGLLFASYILKQNGIKVIYLGQRVPYSNLVNVVKHCKPTHLYTFFVNKKSETIMDSYLKKMAVQFKNQQICVSGNLNNDTIFKKTKIKHLNTISDLLNNT